MLTRGNQLTRAAAIDVSALVRTGANATGGFSHFYLFYSKLFHFDLLGGGGGGVGGGLCANDIIQLKLSQRQQIKPHVELWAPKKKRCYLRWDGEARDLSNRLELSDT